MPNQEETPVDDSYVLKPNGASYMETLNLDMTVETNAAIKRALVGTTDGHVPVFGEHYWADIQQNRDGEVILVLRRCVAKAKPKKTLRRKDAEVGPAEAT